MADLAALWLSAFPTSAGCLQLPVTLCGLPETISIPTSELAALYEPLCKRLAATLSSSGLPRILVGVSGPAGSGKTTLAALLAALFNAAPGALPPAACLSMDAYHMPNSWLARHGLKPFKGRHDTYNAEAFANDLALLAVPRATPPQPPAEALPLEGRSAWAEARPCGGGFEVLLPAYDRAVTHDPQLGAVRIGPEVRLVLVEGLFVARTAPPHWAAARGRLAECIALATPLALCRSRALHRRLRSILLKRGGGGAPGGLDVQVDAEALAQLEAAVAHYKRADMPTYYEVQADAGSATVVLDFVLTEGVARDLGGSVEQHMALPALAAIAALERHSAGGVGHLIIRSCL